MLACLFVAIFVGFPIAFTLIVLAVGLGYIGLGPGVFDLMKFQVFATMREQTLAAVPLFLFMGYILEQAGLMDRLFHAMQLGLARVRGSLYLAVLASATVFAAATGIVGASVTLIGLMAAPTMIRSGYDIRLSAGAITAGGTLGILIPPSVMLVVMGPIMGVSVVELFAGAIVPGLLLAALYTGYAMARAFHNPDLGPPLPPELRAASSGDVVRELLLGIVPPSVLILATLGTIMAGVATPTEGAAVGAFGAAALAVASRRADWKMLRETLRRTLQTSSMIMLLVAASTVFGAVFSRLGTATFMANTIVELRLHYAVMLLLVLAFIFVLGWPLEWVPIVLIFIPILLPVVTALGINLTWFAILIAVCLQTAWLSPPVALSAYFLKGVVPEWSLKEIYMGMLQFMGLQLVGLALIILFPQLVLWLPSLLL